MSTVIQQLSVQEVAKCYSEHYYHEKRLFFTLWITCTLSAECIYS